MSASQTKSTPPPGDLELAFHGRVIDHLGIQMYQSPIAAVAELVANAWDADAERVDIALPKSLDSEATITVEDDGWGMTFLQCQERFLNVGRNRRGKNARELTPGKGRPVLGRKGIGKFAGFGIASIIEIETTSRENGESTTFLLDLEQLRKGKYSESEPANVAILSYSPPDEDRCSSHGTTIRLRNLGLKKRPSPDVQRRGLARRFLLHQRVDDFAISVDNTPLPDRGSTEPIEFTFPADYSDGEQHEGMRIADADGFAEEQLPSGNTVRWQIHFYQQPIRDEELQGIAVFVGGKLAQTPFHFELVGGTTGQAGLPYMSGVVEADFLDHQAQDLIATERQRIDWNNEASQEVLEWGRRLVRELLNQWNERRVEKKIRIIDYKLAPFSKRLETFQPREQRTVRAALKKVAGLKALTDEHFISLAESMLVAWEGGRLHELIGDLAESDKMTNDQLVEILVEANVLSALAGAEAARTQLLVVEGLKDRIQDRDLENPLRDYVAEHPWLLGPKWETYGREIRVTNLLRRAREKAGISHPEAWPSRVDLALKSEDRLLIVEFMRPGLIVDFDHLQRWERYVLTVRTEVQANTALGFAEVHGLLIADSLAKDATAVSKIENLSENGMDALDWALLLSEAAASWRGHFELLVGRGEEDERLRRLAKDLGIPVPEHISP